MNAHGGLCGLFGGTFDPIHFGHLRPVKEVCRIAGLDGVTYIPAAIPPHRSQPEASASDRLEMVRIAVADEPNFSVNDVELKRPSFSYTIDTVQSLRRRKPNQRYALIVGLDALLKFESWYRWHDLQQSVHIIVLGRPGWQLPKPLPPWWQSAWVESSTELHRSFAGKITLVEAEPVPVSATMVRERILAGLDVCRFLPPGVWEYICNNHLYARPDR